MANLTQRRVSYRRQIVNFIGIGAVVSATIIVLAPLFVILTGVIIRGIGSLNWAFFTQLPQPPGETGGGMANAIVGSAMILLVASIIGVPLGVGSGVFLAEYGRNMYGNVVRFTADVLNGIPSVVIGITAYALVVVVQHHFSLLAGGIGLGIMMVPTVTRTTEEVLLMVPQSIREAALGLGIPQWRTVFSVVLPSAMSGIVTGIMLSFARVAGETAPLLFTALGNQFWNLKLNQPTAAVPLQIFAYSISPYDDWHRMAWAGALVLIAAIMITVIFVRFVTSRGMLKGAT